MLMGYAFQGDVYCRACGEEICYELKNRVPDYLMEDSNYYPQPIFNWSDVERSVCYNCGEPF